MSSVLQYMKMMRIVCLVAMLVLGVTQMAVSPWTLTFTNHTSSMWYQFQEDGFEVQQGFAEWYYTDFVDHYIELYLYSDQQYSSFLYLRIDLNNTHLEFSRGRFVSITKGTRVEYGYYQDLDHIDSYLSSAKASLHRDTLTLASGDWNLQVSLVDRSSTTHLHFWFMTSWLLLLPFIALFVSELIDPFQKDRLSQNGSQTGFTLSIAIMKVYWFIFCLIYLINSLARPDPDMVIGLIFMIMFSLGILGCQILLLLEFGVNGGSVSNNGMQACGIVFGYLTFAISKTAVTITSFSSLASLSLLHTSFYAISPLFLLKASYQKNVRAKLGLPYLMYLMDIFSICYIMGCPSNLIHHPQHPNLVLFIIVIVTILTVLLLRETILDYIKEFCQECRAMYSGSAQSGLQSNSCHLCGSSLSLSLSGQPLSPSRVIKGLQGGRRFHPVCMAKVLDDSHGHKDPQTGRQPSTQ